MDNREKIYEHGGELGSVQDLFEITANHVHYLFTTIDMESSFKKLLNVANRLLYLFFNI